MESDHKMPQEASEEGPQGHVCFSVETERGPAFVYGDPDMPEATRQALLRLIEHVQGLLESGWDPDADPPTPPAG